MAASPPYDKEDVKRRMKGAVGTLKHEFAGLRTGRASPSLLDPVQVPAYGNPMPINQVGTVSAPEPRELAKLAAKYAEAARVAVRNVRRDGMEHLKRLEKEHAIGEDVHRKQADELQKLTDENIREIDQALAAKDQEIMHV
jgi:ribosome recycling factor